MRNPLRRSAVVAICAFSAPLVLSATAVQAQGGQTKESTATLDFDLRGARLEDAVTVLTQKSGLNNVVILPGTYDRITLTLRDKMVDVALRAIATAAGAVVEENEGIYYLRPKGQVVATPEKKEPAVVVVEAPAPPARGKKQLAKIELKFLPPSDFVKLLDDPTYNYVVAKAVLPETPKALEPLAAPRITSTPDSGVTGQLDAKPESGAAGAAGQRGGFPGGGFGGGGFGGGGQGRGGGFPGGGFGGGGQGRGGVGQGGFGQGGAGQGGPGQGGAGNVSLRPPGVDNIIASDADNTLIVQGDPGAIDELKALIRLLDVAPKQIHIRAEFVTVNIQDVENFGIQWDITPARNLGISTAPANGNSPTMTMQYASGNAVANLRAAYLKSTNNILQAPIISTSNNTPATVFITDIAYTTQSTVITPPFGGQPLVANQIIPIPSVNFFTVTPHINGDNTVSMFLTPQLQSFSQQVSPGGQVPPRQTTQGLFTFRRIKSGETMMLGGFITKQEDGGEVRLPILGNLPLIGDLFKQKSKTVTGVETLIFVTPTIIEDTNTGSSNGVNLN